VLIQAKLRSTFADAINGFKQLVLVTGLLRSSNVVWQIFPTAPRDQHIEDTVDRFTIIPTPPPSARWLWQQRLNPLPLGIC
jgi:hypothetical protein